MSLFNFGPTAFQNLLYQQAGDSEILHFLGSDRSINSIVLLSNGISFAIQVVLFLILGSYADFGTLRSKILIGLSIVAYAIGFGWLGVHNPSQWQIGTGLYIVGLIGYRKSQNISVGSQIIKTLLTICSQNSPYPFGVLRSQDWPETLERFEKRHVIVQMVP